MDDEEDVYVACCPICSKAWQDEACVLSKEVHVNHCLEAVERPPQPKFICPICRASNFDSIQALQVHANACMDISQANEEEEEETLPSSNCLICLTTLNTLSLSMRIRHVKSCAKEFQVTGPRDIQENTGALEMLIEQSELVEEEEDEAPCVEQQQQQQTNLLQYYASNDVIDLTDSQDDNKRSKPHSTFVSSKPWRSCPAHKKIPGTEIVVDAFQYASTELSTIYILSHFHYDHYIGLTRAFDCGTIYCSPTTARLINIMLKISSSRIKTLLIGTRTQLPDGTFVTALDANHCPGSLVFVFETATTPINKLFVHTGDFRANDALARQVKNLAQRLLLPIHSLYLDTTYCNAKTGMLPTQESVLQTCRAWMKRLFFDNAKRKRILVVIGTYTIGKERLAMECAGEGERIAMTKQKLKLLRACDGFSVQTLAHRFTTERTLSQFWLVPMHVLEHSKLVQLLKRYASRFDEVLAIRGTGWVQTFREQKHPPVTTMFVPYSEHSSLSELRSFVRILNPKTVVPTVHQRGVSTKEMLKLLNY